MERSGTIGSGDERVTMNQPSEKYRRLNPFVDNSVGENIIWASAENDFCDVESINGGAFKTLLAGIQSVDDDGKTRALFLVGPAGAGKSHLFAGLRRKLPRGQFTFVSNPPTSIPHIKRFILKKVVEGLTKPAMGPDGPLPYSQLRRLVYSLLQRFLRERGWSINKIHDRWEKLSLSSCSQKMKRLETNLNKTPELVAPSHLASVLVKVLDKEKYHIACSWLAGNQNLGEADLQSLGIRGPLDDNEIPEIMKQLGHLSAGAGPIILIFDQLDTLVQPDQIHEIESLMIDLNDASRNWYVVLSLVDDNFRIWHSTFSEPFKQRFGTVIPGSVSLAPAVLAGLTERQRSELITARLRTPALISRRKQDNIDDPLYPISPQAFQELTATDTSNPRMLIQKASQAYLDAVTGKPPGVVKLYDFVEQSFADLRAELEVEDLAVDTASLADRTKELFEVLWFVKSSSELTITDGPLNRQIANFEGVDWLLTCGESQVRLVCYDVQRTSKFPRVLNKIMDSQPATILVRDGRAGISGKATKQKLDLFQKDKKFFHLSLDEIKTLHALGRFLAKMREGEFENQDTEPKPTESAIYECLARQHDLAETALAGAFLAMTGLAGPVDENHVSDTEEEVSDGSDHLASDDSVADGVARVMELERWMSFERLCARVNTTGTTADPPKVSHCLRTQPVCDRVLIYPPQVDLLEGIGIVIWNTEE